MLNVNKNKDAFVSDLGLPEKIIIWGIREWLHMIRVAKDPRKSLITGFSQLLVQESVLDFDKFMRVTACSATRKIDVRNKCCLEIGEGEYNILGAMAFSQGKFIEFQKLILLSFIDKKNIPIATNHIDKITNSFTRMGYFFHITDRYLRKVNADPKDFDNVIFYKFNKNDFMKYY